jgi:protein O-mannosyl-transferase
VQTISYVFDYLIWNTETYGYHLSNVLWHVGSGVLLYFLLTRLLPSLAQRWQEDATRRSAVLSTLAFLLSLLWVVHPVHSAAIDYISGRADSLAFFFACGGWLLYLRARETPQPLLRRGFYGLAIVSALLAFCSRESACMWMLVFFIYLFYFDKKIGGRAKLAVLTACLAVVALYAGLRQLPLRHSDSVPSAGSSMPVRATLMLRALGDYGRLMIYPTNLHMERTVFDPASSLSREGWRNSIKVEYLSIGGIAMLAVFLFGVCRKGGGQPVRIFGAAWFLVTYLPISNLFTLNATVAEHWLYLPSVGFLIFFGGVFFDLPTRYRQSAIALASIAVLGLSVRSFIRSSDWVDPETFFRRTFAAGGSSSRIGLNLAVIYAKQGEHAKAETLLRKVLQVSPDYPLARNNLATALSHQGKIKEAEAMFADASKSAPSDRNEYPRTWDAALNLARLQHKENDDAAALVVLERTRTDYPGTWDVISLEAEILRETQGPDAALRIVEDFARDRWWHFGASLALGRIYTEKGDIVRAEAAFRNASWLDVHDAEALNLIALMDMRQNRFDDAYKIQRRAVARRPDEPRQYLLLSEILEKMNRTSEAREALAQISRLQAIANAPVAAN